VIRTRFLRGIFCLVILLGTGLACGQSGSSPIQPLASPLVTSDPSILFKDDFSNTSGEWGRVWDTADGSSVGYADSGYRIVENKPQNISWGVTGKGSFDGDVVIEVDAIKKAGASDGLFGVICRDELVNGQEHFYFMVFDGSSTASINKLADNSVTSLAVAHPDPIPAVEQGSQVHVRAECEGNRLSLFVDDQQLVTATDDSFSTGDAGLIAGSADTPGTDVFFDNFIIHRP